MKKIPPRYFDHPKAKFYLESGISQSSNHSHKHKQINNFFFVTLRCFCRKQTQTKTSRLELGSAKSKAQRAQVGTSFFSSVVVAFWNGRKSVSQKRRVRAWDWVVEDSVGFKIWWKMDKPQKSKKGMKQIIFKTVQKVNRYKL